MPRMALYTIAPSRMHRYVIVVLHLTAAVAVFIADLPWPVRWAIWTVVGAHLYFIWPARAETCIDCGDQGGLRIRVGEDWREVSVMAGSTALPALTVLRWQGADDGSRGTLCVWPDSMPGDDRRRLRVWLRWAARPARSGIA